MPQNKRSRNLNRRHLLLLQSISDILIVPVEGPKESLTGSTFTVTIGEPDDGRIKFNETSTTLPAYTAGEKGNVTMKRTIKANQWSTIVLPFTLTKSKASPATYRWPTYL